MKLNHDCIRAILLDVEETSSFNQFMRLSELLNLKRTSAFSDEDVKYSIVKLKEADYVNVELTYGSNGLYDIDMGSLTWEGHKFLDNIRDDGIWKDTKGILSKFSSTSISIASDIASSVITKLVEKQLGLN